MYPNLVLSESGRELGILLNMEKERFGAGSTMKRVKSRVHATWNNITPVGRVVHTGDIHSLDASIRKRVRYCYVECEGFPKNDTHIFGVSSDLALINRHVFKDKDVIILHISNTDGVHVSGSGWTRVIVRLEDCKEVSTDAVLFHSTIRFNNITSHFFDGPPPDETDGMVGGTKSRLVFGGRLEMDDVAGTIVLPEHIAYKWASHSPGTCGIPIIGKYGNGIVIFGIHCAGAKNLEDSYATVISRSSLSAAVNAMQAQTNFHIASECGIVTESGVLDLVFEDPVPKSMVNFELFHGITYFGKIPGPVILEKESRLKRTKFYREIESMMDDLFPDFAFQEFDRPMMRPHIKNGEYISPYNIAFKKINLPRAALDPVILKKVTTRVCERLDDFKLDVEFVPLTVHQAINGVEGDDYVRRVNAAASAGFGFRGAKDLYLPIMDLQGNRSLTEEVALIVKKDLETYLRGETCHHIYTGKLKDEPREITKCISGKTRLFYMSPLNSLIENKMFLTPFYSLLVEKGEIFGSCVGIDMALGADKLYHELSDFSQCIIEGDYGAFDQHMPIGVGIAAAEIIMYALKRGGYNENSLKVANGILTDNLFVNVEILGDVFQVAGLQPSGKFATAEDNCLRGLVIVLYVWYACDFYHKYGDPFDSLLIRTYGDDLLIASRCDEFNTLFYAQKVKELLDLDFTAADKGAVARKFITPNEMTFLKRNFKHSERFQRVMAPLSLSSIRRMLTWVTPTRHLTEEQQIIAITQSALYEMAIGYETHFDMFRETLIGLLKTYYGISSKRACSKLLTFDQIKTAILSNTIDVLIEENE
jgi:hypothetical protein